MLDCLVSSGFLVGVVSCVVQTGVVVAMGDGCLMSNTSASLVALVSFSSTCDASFFQLVDFLFALRSLVVCFVLGLLKYDVPLRLSCKNCGPANVHVWCAHTVKDLT